MREANIGVGIFFLFLAFFMNSRPELDSTLIIIFYLIGILSIVVGLFDLDRKVLKHYIYTSAHRKSRRHHKRRRKHSRSHKRTRSRPQFRMNTFALLALLAMLFVLFQPAFGSRLGDVRLGSQGGVQYNIIVNLIENPEQIEFGDRFDVGVSSTSIYVMFMALVGSIFLFFLSMFGDQESSFGGAGAILALVYSGINYYIVSQANSSLGIFSMLGGLTFGTAGIVSLLVGVIFLISREY